jgi:hypothetical protein
MSRAKDLRNQEDNFINIYDVMSLFVFEKKHKYTETLLRIMKNTQNIDEHVNEIKKHLTTEFKISQNFLSTLSNLQLIFIYRFIESMFNFEDLKKFQKFCEYNERNLIEQNDMSKYKNFDEVIKAVDMADLVVQEKEMEKQIKILFKNDEWIMLRPLTFAASKKYGSNTKWCTTFNDQSYFDRYTTNGVLIYTINKKTGYKVASYFALDMKNREFSFWDATDIRIDSMETELPNELLKVIFTENKSNKSNRDLFDKPSEEKGTTFLSKFGSFGSSRIATAFSRENDEGGIIGETEGMINESFNTIRETELRPIDDYYLDEASPDRGPINEMNDYLTDADGGTEPLSDNGFIQRLELYSRNNIT